ncbi:hypothetical protein LX15_003534 [Streptoalloteichus tenebrarius]|uniref:Uncharacterized protein n=1 Tax=Streptoalloteichus tenebrarius (strain ATCC 17920 / DSM 40477 / JCM 4838 / CBS 697.72 / NBRC 16177 / NCIMB 11028 / NRRL B-12390 / A12253. 1 / ISP 5477) TaxID=1933 RepID=A0ABT1HWD0_STRSD|nr:permease prefix domain 1-containing protein [Streptoalloteichus tenebrarius]MCP2259825.1 hypothetical protein [Streptoalloteichus tenebrarius]BFE99225.1 hypothetical protein GCM10020241_09010 [Streptoalloteichus tenebrarius]
MTAVGTRVDSADQAGDPIEDYVRVLSTALRGPAQVKARMIQEIHDGLTDAAAAHSPHGAPDHHAASQAVREFGTADDLVPELQRELTLAQTRHTARTVAVSVAALVTCWLLMRVADQNTDWPLRTLVGHLAGVMAAAALLAASTLAVTGPLARRLPVPGRLPRVIAWAGTACSVAMAAVALTLAVTAALATNWPLAVLGAAITAVSHVIVGASARACRECARLDDRPALASSR